ncbi:enoyl-CoA-hydratase DpgB [Dactylosporangium sp. CA-092794]|uniref:enoyl-CoA-hydratase DpgB n=1 Tax=Dactylosporangium sp. CA-092794 TaxID=3239929 RepID=UPI003D8BBC3D
MAVVAEQTIIHVDGGAPLTADAVAALAEVCDRAEDAGGRARVVAHVSGTPDDTWPVGLSVAVVQKWERVVRRFERLPAPTIAVADGACAGAALDVLLAADYRVVTPATELIVATYDGATWPGMALYRLAQCGPQTSGIRRAVLFGEPIPASDALAMHLVDRLTEDVDLAVTEASRAVAGVSGVELAIRRQLLADGSSSSFDEALGAHLAACDRLLRRTGPGR